MLILDSIKKYIIDTYTYYWRLVSSNDSLWGVEGMSLGPGIKWILTLSPIGQGPWVSFSKVYTMLSALQSLKKNNIIHV